MKNLDGKAVNDTTRRFLDCIEALGISDYKVWNTLETLSKVTMSQIRNGKQGVTVRTINEFTEKFPASIKYIMSGTGEPLEESVIVEEGAKKAVFTNEKKENKANNDISARFLEVIAKIGVTDYQLCKNLDSLNRNKMSAIRNGRQSVTNDVLVEFIEKYPSVSIAYIMLGQGEPLLDDKSQQVKVIYKDAQITGDMVRKSVYEEMVQKNKMLEAELDAAYNRIVELRTEIRENTQITEKSVS